MPLFLILPSKDCQELVLRYLLGDYRTLSYNIALKEIAGDRVKNGEKELQTNLQVGKKCLTMKKI